MWNDSWKLLSGIWVLWHLPGPQLCASFATYFVVGEGRREWKCGTKWMHATACGMWTTRGCSMLNVARYSLLVCCCCSWPVGLLAICFYQHGRRHCYLPNINQSGRVPFAAFDFNGYATYHVGQQQTTTAGAESLPDSTHEHPLMYYWSALAVSVSLSLCVSFSLSLSLFNSSTFSSLLRFYLFKTIYLSSLSFRFHSLYFPLFPCSLFISHIPSFVVLLFFSIIIAFICSTSLLHLLSNSFSFICFVFSFWQHFYFSLSLSLYLPIYPLASALLGTNVMAVSSIRNVRQACLLFYAQFLFSTGS